MSNRIVTPSGEVIHAPGSPAGVIARLVEAAATPATYDSAGLELTPKVYADPATVYAVVDADQVNEHPWRLAPLRARKLIAAKAAAGARILAALPDWKQRNLIARQDELGRAESGKMINDAGDGYEAPRTLTSGELLELKAIKDAWAWVTAVRVAEGVLTTAIATAADGAELSAIDVTASIHWPADL